MNRTDPISEMIELAREIRSIQDRAGSFLEVIAEHLRLTVDRPEIYDVFGAVVHRLDKLRHFVNIVDDDDIFPPSRGVAVEAISLYAKAFHPNHLKGDFRSVKSRHFNDNILAIITLT